MSHYGDTGVNFVVLGDSFCLLVTVLWNCNLTSLRYKEMIMLELVLLVDFVLHQIDFSNALQF